MLFQTETEISLNPPVSEKLNLSSNPAFFPPSSQRGSQRKKTWKPMKPKLREFWIVPYLCPEMPWSVLETDVWVLLWYPFCLSQSLAGQNCDRLINVCFTWSNSLSNDDYLLKPAMAEQEEDVWARSDPSWSFCFI